MVQFCSAASISKEESDTGQAEFLILTELCKGKYTHSYTQRPRLCLSTFSLVTESALTQSSDELAVNLSRQNHFPGTLKRTWWGSFQSAAFLLPVLLPVCSVSLFSYNRLFSFVSHSLLTPRKWFISTTQTLWFYFYIHYSMAWCKTFIFLIVLFHLTTYNQQETKACGYWQVLLTLWMTRFHSFICLYLLCHRSAGGLYKAGRAEGSSVMWHCAENPLPDVPCCAAHAQTEACNRTQRPQGSMLLSSWTSEWCIKELINDITHIMH